MRGSGSEWAFMARVVLTLVVGALVLVAIFSRSPKFTPPPPAPAYVPPGPTPEEQQALEEAKAKAWAREQEAQRLAVRIRRDELREDIFRALGKRPPDVTGKAPVKRALPPSSPVPLDRRYVQERIAEDVIPLARDCYFALPAEKLTGRRKAVFSLVIVGETEAGGIVESVELLKGTTLTEPEFADCVKESLSSLTLDPPPNDGWATVTHPVEFSPDDRRANDDGAAKQRSSTAPPREERKLPRAFTAKVTDVGAWGVDVFAESRLERLLEPRMQDCYSKASKSSPDAQGMLELSIKMDEDGDVTTVNAYEDVRSGKPPALGASLIDCAKRAVRTLRFPLLTGKRERERWKDARVEVDVRFSYSPK